MNIEAEYCCRHCEHEWIRTVDADHVLDEYSIELADTPCPDCESPTDPYETRHYGWDPLKGGRYDVLCGCGWGLLATTDPPVRCPVCHHPFIDPSVADDADSASMDELIAAAEVLDRNAI